MCKGSQHQTLEDKQFSKWSCVILLLFFLLAAVEGNGAWRRWKRLLLSNWVLFDAVVEKDVSAA